MKSQRKTPIIATLLLLLPVFYVPVIHAVVPSSLIVERSDNAVFPIVSSQIKAVICSSEGDFVGVARAIKDLQTDIEKVTDQKVSLSNLSNLPEYPIVIGTVGKNALIDQWIQTKKLSKTDLVGKWESYVLTTLDNPLPGVKKALVIAGSDKRGTIYGIYELSKQLGISPWYWWADVPPLKRKEAYFQSGYYASGEPKVKYRGIFINDENPAMQTWSRTHFGGMNSKMYAHMFELLLRLKGNCLWPGMWGSFKEYKPLVPVLKNEQGDWEGNCFNEDDPENPRLADEYGIVMGTSHHEPMQRSQQEWIRNKAKFGNGEWNYVTNKEGIQRFFKEGIQNTKNYESLITIGMRGDEDRPMVDAGSAEANFKVLEGIMKDQRKIIQDVAGKKAKNFQQIWTLYSEVLDYYDKGMHVPDDVIVVLCDDNWGNVRRVPTLDGKKHPGGYGMYYHVAYYGAPRATKWISVNQIQHMWEQLQLTYEYGVDKLWILNVADLKPAEFPMDFFMNMAWDPTQFNEKNLMAYTESFCAQQFGADQAKEAASILNTHCKYTSRVTPEMLDDKTYALENGEFLSVRDAYLALEALALRQYMQLPVAYKDAYKELILFPVQGMANLYDMYYALAMNKKMAAEKHPSANDWADRVEACFKRDSMLCADYNLNIAGGKWNQMMIQPHIGYTNWHGPQFNVMPKVMRVRESNEPLNQYVFTEKNGVVAMEAAHYFEAMATPETQWTVFPDMGRNASCLALRPYTKSVGSSSLKYAFLTKIKKSSLQVHLIFRTIMPFVTGGHKVSISINGSPEKIININEDLTWKNNYSKMYPAGAARVIEKQLDFDVSTRLDSKNELVIKPLDPGIVFQKIIVDLGGMERSYLKLPESPYKK